MPPENPSFLIRGDDGENYGPVDLGELREWVRENRAGLGTTVRLDEPGALWQPWQYHPELVALLAEAQASHSPVPGQPGLVIAPMGRRILAFAVDLILCWILLVPIAMVVFIIGLPDTFVHLVVASSLGQVPDVEIPPAYNLLFSLLIALYKAGFEYAHGQTPGKALLHIRVVDDRGEDPNASRSLIRGLLFSFSLFLLVPLFFVFFLPQRRAIHDLMAGTYVVEA